MNEEITQPLRHSPVCLCVCLDHLYSMTFLLKKSNDEAATIIDLKKWESLDRFTSKKTQVKFILAYHTSPT